MIIRKMSGDEIEIVRTMRLPCYEGYKDFVSEENRNVLKGRPSSKNDLKPGVEIFVAEINGKVVGSVVLFPGKFEAYEWTTHVPDYPEIRMLAVDQGWRGKGIGESLMQHCIESSAKQGYSAVGLHTAEFMKNALSLYRKMNFHPVPELDFEPANDGIIVKELKYFIPHPHVG
ncbi:GNAT family N-acetyltransferase [Bacillus sp. BHET2]|uniref:GNAT family N-acetyltransferase n=1 Tax=Bacillus sp. BHET2 TaxID=2583818 RepID=UPI00110EB224|nr:GNAT family N-acetyltransferase [Bacillus sp. BHET2]TMU83469.1 GNAT family N-acetyltransferase [Bacillus sp. BHET2]